MQTDVLIIGAGLAGGVTAATLGGHGFDVLCLEQGTWPDYRTPVHPLEFDLRTDRTWPRVPEVRGSPADYPIDASASPIEPLMWNGMGGSTVLYLAKWHRMLPSDFRIRAQDGVAVDWPFGYVDLEPYYTEAERQFQVSGMAGDPAYPPGGSPPNPPLPLREFGHRMAHGLNELGWSWWPGASSVFPQEAADQLPYGPRGTGSEAAASGTAGPVLSATGIRRTVKASTDITHWPGALARGVELITDARVRRILHADGRATGAEFVDATGLTRTVTAAHVILCANGIGTPRLLLASAENRDGAGLADSSGVVGSHLMVHPLAAIAGVFPEPVDGAVSPLGAQLQSTHFYETDASRGFVRGAKWGLQPAGGAWSHLLSYPWTQDGGARWGSSFDTTMHDRLDHSAMWSIVSEDLPHESNRVLLDWSRKDRAGGPGVAVQYSLDGNSTRLLDFHVEHASRAMRAAGASEVIVDPLVRASGWHLMGTARMGEDPARSVTDPFGRCHDIPNLHIFDSSTWPTSSGLNPAATQAAVALRSAEHFLEEESW